MAKRHRRPVAALLGVLAIAGMEGCPAPNASMPPSPNTPTDGIQPLGAMGHQAVVLDVDPLHGAAFERQTGESADGLSLLVGVPDVRHDLTTGKTTLSVQVTNAGAALANLAVTVGGDRRLLTPVSPIASAASGDMRTFSLTFDNPGGDSFSLALDFSARLVADATEPASRHVLATGVANVTASSSYGSLTADRAADGDMNTQWANGGYQEPEAWLQLDLGTSQSLAALDVKMRPFSGNASYRIEVSDDGSRFTTVTGDLRNTSWGTETKALPAGTSGRYVRLHFLNGTSPEGRFSVFEATVHAGSGTGPTPEPPSATPTPAPTTTPTTAPTQPPSTGGLTATASGSYNGLTPANAIDGDFGSQWASGGYRDAEAWLQLDTGAVRALSSVSTKMRPTSGSAHYRVEVSDDGSQFSAVTGDLQNTSWGTETKALPSGTSGRFVRLHFFNDASSPMDRFSVFEAGLGMGGSTGSTPTPTPTPAPTSTPTPPPSTGGGLFESFEGYGLGADPSSFVDPNDEGYSYSWMPRVHWHVADSGGSKQFVHDGLSNTANLSFRRYRGGALGTSNGQLPSRYFAELDVTPIKSYTYAPTGDQGTQFYYLNPTNYVELLFKPNNFEVWVADDAPPFQSRGWSRIYFDPMTTQAGQKRHLAAEVDTNAHTIKIYVDGQLETTLSTSKLSNQTHYFAMRGAGNIVAHDNLRIEGR